MPGLVMEPAIVHDMKEAGSISPLEGQPAPTSMLLDVARLEREYYERKPELDDATQLVAFGTSGHRGSPLRGSFPEAHVAAITQAICDYRRGQGIDGPLYEECTTTTTPFDMCVLNDLDCFHLVSDVIDRVPKLGPRAAYAKQAIRDKLLEHKQYIARRDDMLEITGWKWGQQAGASASVRSTEADNV